MRKASITSIGEKVTAIHVENHANPELDALDSIELTETGKFSWLISITAAIGGMLFGLVSLARHNMRAQSDCYLDMTPASSRPSWSTYTAI